MIEQIGNSKIREQRYKEILANDLLNREIDILNEKGGNIMTGNFSFYNNDLYWDTKNTGYYCRGGRKAKPVQIPLRTIIKVQPNSISIDTKFPFLDKTLQIKNQINNSI